MDISLAKIASEKNLIMEHDLITFGGGSAGGAGDKHIPGEGYGDGGGYGAGEGEGSCSSYGDDYGRRWSDGAGDGSGDVFFSCQDDGNGYGDCRCRVQKMVVFKWT